MNDDMKSITILLLSMLSFSVNAHDMEKTKVNETVSELFVATDNKNWSKVENIFAEIVELDYSSMNGNPAVKLTPEQITDNWKGILPGFTHTHHQLGNFLTNVNENQAVVFFYGTATHYLPDDKGNVWTVVGSYNLELEKIKGRWRIVKMKFNFKYQDGNTDLPQKAINKLKK